MEEVVVECQQGGMDSSAGDVGMTSSKKRKPEESDPGEQPSLKRAEISDKDESALPGSSGGQIKSVGSNGNLLEGGGQTAEEADAVEPADILKMNGQLLELVHELEAHLFDSGKPVQKTKFSESVEASQQRLNRYKKKKHRIATPASIPPVEVRRKQGGIPAAGSMPASTASTFGHGIVSPSVWSQGVFSNVVAPGGAAGGQGLASLLQTGEETPVSEYKQAGQESQKPVEGASAPGAKDDKPASSGSGQGSKEKGEEVDGAAEGVAARGDEALAKLVIQKEEEIGKLRTELQAIQQQTGATARPDATQALPPRTPMPDAAQALPPMTPRGPSGNAPPAALAATVAELEKKLAEVTAENTALQTTVKAARADAEKQEVRIATLESIISKKDAAHTELAAQLEAARKGTEGEGSHSDSELKNEVRQLREALEVVHAVEGELRRQSAEKDSRITAAASIVEQLKQATEHLQEEKKLKEAETVQLRRENGELHAQVAEAMRLLNAQEESIAALQKQLQTAADPVSPPVIEAAEAQAARSILEVAKEFNVKTIDKLKVELQKARLVESLEAALQQSIKELAHQRSGQHPGEAPSKAHDTGLLRLRELEAVLANLERENAGLRHELADAVKDKRKGKDWEEEKLQKQLDNKTREVEDLSKDLQASYVQHSKVQRMLELLREANIGSVEKVRIMIKRHQQFDSLEGKVRTLEAENASLQRKLKRLQGAPPDVGSPAADPQKPWVRPEGAPGKPAETDDNSREDVPIANRKLGKTNSVDGDRVDRNKGPEGEKTSGEGKGAEGEGALALGAPDLEALVSRVGGELGGPRDEERLRDLLKAAERVGELEQAIAEQKHRADKAEARLKKSNADDKTSASESQALSAMVRVLGLERGGNESGVVAIEKALQAAASEREAMKKELEQKREEVDVMARRLRDISHKNAKMEELHQASAEAAGEAAGLQMQLITSQSMLQQLQRRNRSLLMDAAAAQAVLELLRGPYIRDVGQLQLLLERAIELSISEQR
ncbi:hypothetical protein KFL_000010180 [Klebsormidium nitens]|uniref:Uncharacterized protein n=1 Tax=Klebsormidium nitens TaxID=105231 RepID=A0A0U9HHW8_KLENI|nr:hypothetical protein KFL_000010180 [Klebsormidium nitens]|eukprot:GAQ77569.1 hypothetical protein KFL_000010180 [Klebsormidium nitens]